MKNLESMSKEELINEIKYLEKELNERVSLTDVIEEIHDLSVELGNIYLGNEANTRAITTELHTIADALKHFNDSKIFYSLR